MKRLGTMQNANAYQILLLKEVFLSGLTKENVEETVKQIKTACGLSLSP
jgi:hypothetical protein